MKQLTLLTRPGCHLCQDARAVVLEVGAATGTPFVELDVDADGDLRAEYGDMVPVVLIDGVQHGYFRIDPSRLREALLR